LGRIGRGRGLPPAGDNKLKIIPGWSAGDYEEVVTGRPGRSSTGGLERSSDRDDALTDDF
jgi:hypothetical protein